MSFTRLIGCVAAAAVGAAATLPAQVSSDDSSFVLSSDDPARTPSPFIGNGRIGLVIPGFIPSPLGEVVEYVPSLVELGVTAGIWATGLFVLTVLVKVAIPIELGESRSPFLAGPRAAPLIRPRATRPTYDKDRPVRIR